MPSKLRNANIGHIEFVTIIAMLMAVNSLGIDIILPCLPQIGEYVGIINENHRQHLISFYLIGFAIGQIFYGPLSDRFGRKAVLIPGLMLYVISTIAVLFTTSFSAMLFFRLIQGIGGAAPRIISISIIRDIYGGRQMAKVLSISMMIFMIMPIIAPSIGQLTMYISGSWAGIFVWMAAIASAITIWYGVRIPETMDPLHVRSLHWRLILGSFSLIFKDRAATLYNIANSLLMGAIFGFVSSSQQIYTEVYNLGAWFPLAFAIGGISMSLSSLLNTYLVDKLGRHRLSHYSLLILVAVTTLWLITQLIVGQSVSLFVFFAFFLLSFFQIGLINANFSSISIEPFAHLAGTASSVFGFINTVISTGIGIVIGQAFDGTTYPLTIGFFVIAVFCFIAIFIAEKGKMFQNKQDE
ncbi:MAG: Bcr/CflA family efflux MFS transporter [Candidatus Liberibacter ctenarytainae]|uniref:Bcr/CflA family efflux transporter n=1 Tax=Candidatus Liberibacter ctenarytainae TaxID=2020335 RepID=A0A937AF89_9HYPH|nr:Bcr/CflA family efflux MFS transporter [Candidatus Liberibacter ctenarytainae]